MLTLLLYLLALALALLVLHGWSRMTASRTRPYARPTSLSPYGEPGDQCGLFED